MAKNAHALVNGVPSFSQRVADQYLEVTDFFLVIWLMFQWTEGKFTVWDDSFENEMKNESGTAQVSQIGAD